MMVENLDSFDRDVLLRWFLHYQPMGTAGPEPTKATRCEFMRQYPVESPPLW